MSASKSLPLEPLDFRARPLAPHAIAWSCDAELAVAADDSVQIYLPEWPKLSAIAAREDIGNQDLPQPQFSLSLSASGIVKPDPAINGQLCAFAGVRIPALSRPTESLVFQGAGSGPIGSNGGTAAQTVRAEWSPSGLGFNSRPVLTVLTTSGALITLGEVRTVSNSGFSSAKTRVFKNWKIVWGLGAQLPIPDGDAAHGVRRMDERIVSFSWANEIDGGRGLMAYMTDEGEVVVMCVQYHTRESNEEGWEIFELARFDGRGCHDALDGPDADYVPFKSSSALKWSPWHVTGTVRTAMVAYLAHNHVGFRRVTISAWDKGVDPAVTVEEVDSASICAYMSTDAFVEWEDTIYQEGPTFTARGVIATPLVVKPFQINVAIDAPPADLKAIHATTECATSYPLPSEQTTNPITGLIVHSPGTTKPSEPQYSLVRLSAAPNQDWYETNITQTSPPQWTEQVHKSVTRQVPRPAALAGIDSDSESDSGLEGINDMVIDDPQRPVAKVHPCRFRLWGLASSPGGGCTAVVLSKHSTQHSDRRGKCRILFSWQDAGSQASTRLTTEGAVWEAMYGVLRGTDLNTIMAPTSQISSPLRASFKSVVLKQSCVFCKASLVPFGSETTCERGHSFGTSNFPNTMPSRFLLTDIATCTATGLAIMEPGVSRACSICGQRCLSVSALTQLANKYLDPNKREFDERVCGSCGGKFLA